jgi:hypothetical protein
MSLHRTGPLLSVSHINILAKSNCIYIYMYILDAYLHLQARGSNLGPINLFWLRIFMIFLFHETNYGISQTGSRSLSSKSVRMYHHNNLRIIRHSGSTTCVLQMSSLNMIMEQTWSDIIAQLHLFPSSGLRGALTQRPLTLARRFA